MSDRTAILTGVTGGWGRAVLDRFLSQGWNVCATSRDATDDLPEGVLVVQADLTDPASAERVVAACVERFGGVRALGCVAGGFKMSGPLHESSPDDWRSQLAVNLDTAYTMTRAALRISLRWMRFWNSIRLTLTMRTSAKQRLLHLLFALKPR